MDERRFTARWVLPVSQAPLENATLVVSGQTVVEVWPRRDPAAVDLGSVALLPALVNAHTHLEFSDLQQPLPADGGFFEWIRRVVERRRAETVRPVAAVERGLRECVQHGTAAVGEIATDDRSFWQADTASVKPRPHVVLFRELYTLDPAEVDGRVDTARRHLQQSLPPAAAGLVTLGLSPHAPYTVHPDLFLRLVELAASHRAPLAMHLAETLGERQLLERQTGPCAEMLEHFGLWNAQLFHSAPSVLDYLRELARLDHALVVHGNYLTDEELAFVARHPNLTVVYCPRTHAWFGHAPHPWRRLLERGGNVALGTDSRASSPDLSVWNELCFLAARHPGEALRLLELATLRAARALGLSDRLGSLEPGKLARAVVVPLSSDGPLERCLFRARSVRWLELEG